MVMENPTISAQSVGREFVRQYYTLMHEAPSALHRFYSHNSSFVHGGVEPPGQEAPPICGQSAIHAKITELDFQDCHAKIRQVDSQATVGESVVVQVTGELSNKGQPMRRFMQTFILVPQTPKKYYVMNDIFRYQDEVFQDESDPETEEAQASYTEAEQEPLENGQEEEATPTFLEPEKLTKPLSNGTGHIEEAVEIAVVDKEEEPKPVPEEKAPQAEEKPEPEPTPLAPEPEQPAPAVESKHFSWAAMASKNTPSGPVTAQPPPAAAVVSKPVAPRVGDLKVDPRPVSQDPLPQRPSRGRHPSHFRGPVGQPRMGGDRENRASATRGEGDGDNDSLTGRRPNLSRFPDNQQLFVGNLPHNVNEKDLKIFFENYGPVIEMRINTKSAGGKLPNFGFVVFESAETVQKVLAAKEKQPIKFNGEHRLNIEEKKPREGRVPSGRGGMGRNSMQTMSRGGMNQGVGRGGMRGGMNRSEPRGSTMSGQSRASGGNAGNMMKR